MKCHAAVEVTEVGADAGGALEEAADPLRVAFVGQYTRWKLMTSFASTEPSTDPVLPPASLPSFSKLDGEEGRRGGVEGTTHRCGGGEQRVHFFKGRRQEWTNGPGELPA